MTNFIGHLLSEWRSSILIFKPENLNLFVLLTLNTVRLALRNATYWYCIALFIFLEIAIFWQFGVGYLYSFRQWWIPVITISFVRPTMTQKNLYTLFPVFMVTGFFMMVHILVQQIWSYSLLLVQDPLKHSLLLYIFAAMAMSLFQIAIYLATFFFLDQNYVQNGRVCSLSSLFHVLKVKLIIVVRSVYDAFVCILFTLPWMIISVLIFDIVLFCLGFLSLLGGVPHILGTIFWMFWYLLFISWLSVLYIKKAHEDFNYYFPHKRQE
ncbi:MAG: hypothetical protein WCE21_03515 [Candidatus Babeliales bacterium]